VLYWDSFFVYIGGMCIVRVCVLPQGLHVPRYVAVPAGVVARAGNVLTFGFF